MMRINENIVLVLLSVVLLSGCASKMKNDHLLNIINKDEVIYDWEQNRNSIEELNQTIKNAKSDKLGTIYQERSGMIRKYNFVYENGKKVELITMGDYTWPIKLTQAHDSTLHLFYFAGLSVYRYMVVEFDIDAGKIKKYGLPRRNDFYSNYYK